MNEATIGELCFAIIANIMYLISCIGHILYSLCLLVYPIIYYIIWHIPYCIIYYVLYYIVYSILYIVNAILFFIVNLIY